MKTSSEVTSNTVETPIIIEDTTKEMEFNENNKNKSPISDNEDIGGPADSTGGGTGGGPADSTGGIIVPKTPISALRPKIDRTRVNTRMQLLPGNMLKKSLTV